MSIVELMLEQVQLLRKVLQERWNRRSMRQIFRSRTNKIENNFISKEVRSVSCADVSNLAHAEIQRFQQGLLDEFNPGWKIDIYTLRMKYIGDGDDEFPYQTVELPGNDEDSENDVDFLKTHVHGMKVRHEEESVLGFFQEKRWERICKYTVFRGPKKYGIRKKEESSKSKMKQNFNVPEADANIRILSKLAAQSDDNDYYTDDDAVAETVFNITVSNR